MYERLLLETEQYLIRQKQVVVPLKKLWVTMTQEGRKNSFTVPNLADFSCLLDGDRRFEFIKQTDREEESSDLLESEELEKLGFLESQAVKLRRIPLPDEDDNLDDEITSTEDDELVDMLLDREMLAQKAETIRKKKKIIESKNKISGVNGKKSNVAGLPKGKISTKKNGISATKRKK
jgi:hypothetical protein